jgi:pyruvate dehydrogenase E2 component (dihydrolipoamide acetyltransferase)
VSVREIAVGLSELIDEARAGKTSSSKMRDNTFHHHQHRSVRRRRRHADPESGRGCDLVLRQIRRQPWEYKGRILLRELTTVAMSFDHRLVDGELGSKVLRDGARQLEDPNEMILD